MDYIPFIALGVSIAALVISALSLWFSWGAQHHTQIVSFEQRRQEVRQIFLEGQLIVGERNDELNRAILVSENQLIVGKMSEPLKRKFLESIKIVRGGITQNTLVRHEYETVLRELDQIPSSPSTQARLDLERLGGAAIQMKNRVQAQQLKELRDALQALDDTLEGIGRNASK